jgi:AcrR family transcriptional regulator
MKNKSITQQRILEAAISLFAAQGYHGTSTSEIAGLAMVAEGTVFKYYRTKKQLLRAVLGHIIHEVVPSIMQQPFDEILQKCKEEDAKAAIKQVLLEKVAQISKNINCVKVVVNEIQYHEDLKNEYLGQLVPGFIMYMEGVYKIGVDRGVFRNINPHTAVRSFMGSFAFLVMEKNLLNKQIEVSGEIDTILDIYINGVIEKRGNNV